jgi:hypothetical protein
MIFLAIFANFRRKWRFSLKYDTVFAQTSIVLSKITNFSWQKYFKMNNIGLVTKNVTIKNCFCCHNFPVWTNA